MTTEELQRMSNADLKIDAYPFTIRTLSQEDGGGYLIEYPDLQGCMSDGETPEEAIHNGKDALRSVLLTKMEFGDPIPEPDSSGVYLHAGVKHQLVEIAARKGVVLSDLVNYILEKNLDIVAGLR